VIEGESRWDQAPTIEIFKHDDLTAFDKERKARIFYLSRKIFDAWYGRLSPRDASSPQSNLQWTKHLERRSMRGALIERVGASTVSGVWIRRKRLASIVVRATKFAKLEEGERRGTLRKEAVGLGRDASPSSDDFLPYRKFPFKVKAIECLENACIQRVRANRIMSSCAIDARINDRTVRTVL